VASPEAEYVAAGTGPLRVPVGGLQARLDAPVATTEVRGAAGEGVRSVPTVESGLTDPERATLRARGLLDEAGRITPLVVEPAALDLPERLLTPALWDALYRPPEGDVTIEHVQHSFYMAANYGFQILNGNFAAAIDDYELKLRFMNDLATYRIYVSWLWSLFRHRAPVTRDGHLLRQVLTEDGVVLGAKAEPVKAGTPLGPELFDKVFAYHDEWTAAFFAEQDRSGAAARFDRSKAPVIMELLRRQLRSARWVQHSARVLFVVGQASAAERDQVLEAIFDLPRERIVERVRAGTMDARALAAHDYALDVTDGEPAR
jgi:malate synthase